MNIERKKGLWIVLLLIVAVMVAVSLTSCNNDEDHDFYFESQANNQTTTQTTEHVHGFSSWEVATQPTCTVPGLEKRFCSSCGFIEYSELTALGHSAVTDCSVAATCSADGKTEGSHCQTCNAVLVEQKTIPATAHQYEYARTLRTATCLQNGLKQFACTKCSSLTSQSYSLPTYSASEIYQQSIQYVGEIVTYDRSGAEYKLGTGFVMSADGKVITNHHVIEGAYSAKITINQVTYSIQSVLAYDADIDLAVVKINETNLTAATVCKNAVQVGETVYAIGSSRGMTNTYTQGIVAYANRVVDGVTHVQHDASITHGNSGGPLLNVNGEVIGINTWGINESQNLNFAVFTAELDRLVYGSPMTMEEFYFVENGTPYERFVRWIIDNGEYDTTINTYEMSYTHSESDYTMEIDVAYDEKADYAYISLVYLSSDGNMVYSVLDLCSDDTGFLYYCSFGQGETWYNNTYGEIDGATFTPSSTLTYEEYEGYPELEAELMELYEMCIHSQLSFMDLILEEEAVGVTLADLGFTVYVIENQ